MWNRVDVVLTDVSEERIAYIFRIEISASEEPAWAGGCRLTQDLQDATLKTILHSPRCVNHKSYEII
jgi:hypothetical protein